MSKKPVMLCILDGWGLREEKKDNAILLAETPYWDLLQERAPMSSLNASGLSVGLPEGQMGNSEVGHLNIGAGRKVYQNLTRINKSIKDGDFFENTVLVEGMERPAKAEKSVHLLGLLSDGGVHSHIDQIIAMVRLAKQKCVKKLYLHALLDGRDVAPTSALIYIEQMEKAMKEMGVGEIATVSGRYYTMDRDKRWDRVEKGYNAMAKGEGLKAASAMAAVEEAYKREENDEFVLPTVIGMDKPVGLVQDGDTLIFCNFRADRAREITRAFIEDGFKDFDKEPLNVEYICLTEYEAALDVKIAFPPEDLTQTLGEVLAEQGKKQLRIAETEKYAHVTFFFNGGKEEPNQGEERILIPSPMVATYDLQPEMSAFEVTTKVVNAIEEDIYDVIILNFANPDMVGHTGVLEAAITAAEIIDACLMNVVEAVKAQDGAIFITADHGNCETMRNEETGKPHTAHTTNLVPFLMVSGDMQDYTLADGCLEDIAPTMLEVLDIEQPAVMTGKSLRIKK
jgi:2,3-bisphosphoglycerate-independent phosphoglycerate mutase